MNPYAKRLTAIVFAILSHSISHAQATKPVTLSGCCKVTKMEQLHPDESSADLAAAATKIITCFDGKGKFTSKTKTATGFDEIGTGTYSMSADGKTLHSSRDNAESGIDSDPKIISFTEEELVLSVEDEVIIHMKKADN